MAQALRGVQVAPIQGRAGWLVRTALEDRLGARRERRVYRLEVELDDNITGFGIRSDDAVTRERRTLRARYRLVDAARGTVLLDATAGSDAGVDVVSSEYATVAAEQTALERLVDRSSPTRSSRASRSTRRGAGARPPRRRNEGQPAADRKGAARPPAISASSCSTAPTIRAAAPWSRRSRRRWAPEAERIDLGGADLRGDPARLADEAASISMFGGARWILVEPAGDESLAGARGPARSAGGGQSGRAGRRKPQAGLQIAQARARRARGAGLRELCARRAARRASWCSAWPAPRV